MSTVFFPELPGLTWTIKQTPKFKTLIQSSDSGREARARLRQYPLWEFELEYEFLANDAGEVSAPSDGSLASTDFETLQGFFLARAGAFDPFLLRKSLLTRNPDDDTLYGQLLGTGDGSTTGFQLVRAIGGGTDLIQSYNGTPTVYLNGVPTTAFTMGNNGLVQLTAAPATGVVVTADFSPNWVVRFADDSLDFEALMYLFWECRSVKLVSVKLGSGDALGTDSTTGDAEPIGGEGTPTTE